MSSGPACTVKGHRHVVLDRYANHSAFNGYRRTPSRYSGIRCLVTGLYWRTAAAYVGDLPDATHEEAIALPTGDRP